MAVRIAGRLSKNLLCILTKSLDACSGVLVGWNIGLRLKALICFTDFRTRILETMQTESPKLNASSNSSARCHARKHEDLPGSRLTLNTHDSTIRQSSSMFSTHTVQCRLHVLVFQHLLPQCHSFMRVCSGRLPEYSSLVEGPMA